MLESKTCSCCKQEKVLSMFYKDKTKPGGYRTKCKDCTKQAKKKKCRYCKTMKPSSEFYTNSARCKTCEKERSAKKSKGIDPQSLADIGLAYVSTITKQKKCVSCEQTKDLHEFAKNNRLIDGYSSSCKLCEYQQDNTTDPVAWNMINKGLRSREQRFLRALEKYKNLNPTTTR